VVHAGEKLKIPCRVDNDPANRITNITWEKDGNPITVSSEDRCRFLFTFRKRFWNSFILDGQKIMKKQRKNINSYIIYEKVSWAWV
jgi:hypothetical protein